jgi:predicted GNAT superfamily acetyltransferase
LGGSQFEASPGKKKFMRTYFNPQKLGIVVTAYHPNYMGSINITIVV